MERNEFDRIDDGDEQRRGRRRQSWAVPVAALAILALIGVSIWGYSQHRQLKDMGILVGNQYNRAFVDLSDYVDNLEVLLAKSMVTSTPVSTSGMLAEVWREANLAQTNMGQLPVAPPLLEKTSNFLTQVGDMAYALNTKTMKGMTLSGKEYDNLKKMHGFAVSLQKSLHGIENQINAGQYVWGKGTTLKASGSSSTKKTNPQTSMMENVDKNFQEYPSLVYDGPYSDHMLKSTPIGLKNKNVTADEAREIARKAIGADKIKDIKEVQGRAGSGIQTYHFKVYYKNLPDNQSADVEVTKKGGQLYSIIRNRPIGKDTLSMADAKKAASSFLSSNGFDNMVDTYYEKVDGIAVISYIYHQDDVKVYPDQAKVKVALDNGEILGVEAKSYLYNHKVRTIPAAKLTIDDARKKVNTKLGITSQGRAIIPTDFKTEKYCYEFIGKVDDHDFIIYINAQTGAEEDVLMLVKSENGTLTM